MSTQSPQHPQRRPTAGSSALCRDDLSASWIGPADRSLGFCADSAASLFTLGTGSGLHRLWLGLSHTGFPSKIRSDTHLRAPSVRPRSPQGFPRPPTARPSLSSSLRFLVQRELRLFRAHLLTSTTILLPLRAQEPRQIHPSKSQSLSQCLACSFTLLAPIPGSSHWLLEPVCAHAVPSLGMPFLGLESSSFLVFPDIFGHYTVPPLGAHSVPLFPQVISGPVDPPMHPGGPGSAWNRAQVARGPEGLV